MTIARIKTRGGLETQCTSKDRQCDLYCLFAENQPFQQIYKKCTLTRLALLLRKDYGITNNLPGPPHDT